MCVKRYYR